MSISGGGISLQQSLEASGHQGECNRAGFGVRTQTGTYTKSSLSDLTEQGLAMIDSEAKGM